MMSQDVEMARVTLVQQKHTNMLMDKKHVMGVGAGMRQKGGVSTGEICLVVMVDEKLPLGMLDAKDVVPAMLDGVRVDVQAIGVPRAY